MLLQILTGLSLALYISAFSENKIQLDETVYAEQLKSEILEKTGMSEADFKFYQDGLRTLNQLAEYKQAGHIMNQPPPVNLLASDPGNDEVQTAMLFEGDMILTKKQMQAVVAAAKEQVENLPKDVESQLETNKVENKDRNRRKLISDTRQRWTKNINYRIDTASGVDSGAVERGLNLWRDNTCLKFNRIHSQSGDYMEFFRGSGCFSNVGRVGGRQTVSIGYGCTKVGIVAHEIGHALGFWHEQSRPDRDAFIRIIEKNIQSGTLGNFWKRGQGELMLHYPFDYGSVMHYGPTAFAKSWGMNTIQTVDSNAQNTIGQRDQLSFYDIKFINKAYCDDVCPSKLNCEHNGYTDPQDCTKCKCPDGFDGKLCERAQTGSGNCGTVDLTATSAYQTISKSGGAICYYHIKAPAGKKVLIEVQTFSFFQATTCYNNYLEIKYESDLGKTGPRMCSKKPTNSYLSKTNEALVVYKGSSPSNSFSIRFRYDPATPIMTTALPPTQTTPVTATGWTEWTSWSNCSFDCGGCGSQTRTRTCQDGSCVGPSNISQVCNLNACATGACCLPFTNVNGVCKMDGGSVLTTTQAPSSTWSIWTAWSSCTGGDCGLCGKKTRSRTCLEGPCSGPKDETQVCGSSAVCTNCGGGTGEIIGWHICPDNAYLLCPIRATGNSENCPCCAPYTTNIRGVCQI